MFNKILGKKDKGLDVFLLPEKKYCRDAKKWAKMERKDLLDELDLMEKYISVACGKVACAYIAARVGPEGVRAKPRQNGGAVLEAQCGEFQDGHDQQRA